MRCSAHLSTNNALSLSFSLIYIFRLSLKTVDDANDHIWLGPKGGENAMAAETSWKVKICAQPTICVEEVCEQQVSKQKFCQMQNQIKMEFINISINRFTSKLIAPVNASNVLHSARTSDAVMS